MLWVEKYKPKNVEDLVVDTKVLNIIKGILNKKEIPNMTLSSKRPGIGKTSIAKILAYTICGKHNTLFINGSLDRNIDVLRNEMTEFVYADSIDGNKKCIIIDEAEYMNVNSLQPSLRNFIEENSKNCSFILTCNYSEKIIEPLLSRCPVLDISVSDADDKRELAIKIMDRAKFILEQENISYDIKILPPLIKKLFPDIRKIITELQKYSISGKLELNAIPNNMISNDNEISELVEVLKTKDFNKLRNWAHKYYEYPDIYTKIYEGINNVIDPNYRSDFILTVAEYNYKSSIATAPEITLAALITEIMKKF